MRERMSFLKSRWLGSSQQKEGRCVDVHSWFRSRGLRPGVQRREGEKTRLVCEQKAQNHPPPPLTLHSQTDATFRRDGTHSGWFGCRPNAMFRLVQVLKHLLKSFDFPSNPRNTCLMRVMWMRRASMPLFNVLNSLSR